MRRHDGKNVVKLVQPASSLRHLHLRLPLTACSSSSPTSCCSINNSINITSSKRLQHLSNRLPRPLFPRHHPVKIIWSSLDCHPLCPLKGANEPSTDCPPSMTISSSLTVLAHHALLWPILLQLNKKKHRNYSYFFLLKNEILMLIASPFILL